MDVNSHGFTEIDKELKGSNRFADPLGSQVVWSHFGRVLVPNLTEQTWHASGFYLLVCILYLYDRYRKEWIHKQENEKTVAVEDFYILGEQMFAYATVHHQGEAAWVLPGGRNLRNYYYHERQSGDYKIRVGLERQLLGSQLSGGTWGLYRGAAIRSGILEETGRQLTEAFGKGFDRRSLKLSDKQICNMYGLIQEANKARASGAEFNLASKLAGELSETLRLMGGNRSLLKKYLIENHITAGSQLLLAVAEKLKEQAIQDKDYRKFVSKCGANWFKEHAVIFDDITRCEDLIGTMESTFRFLYGNRKETLKNIFAKIPLDIKELRDAHARFKQAGNRPQEGLAAKRYRMYVEEIALANMEEYIESLLRIHGEVARGRGGSAWIEVELGRLRINEDYGEYDADALAAMPGKGWLHYYYLDTLTSIYKDCEI